MTNWRKSSHSGSGGNDCVEIGNGRLVRDSKNPAGPRLNPGLKGMAAFVAAVKQDRLS